MFSKVSFTLVLSLVLLTGEKTRIGGSIEKTLKKKMDLGFYFRFYQLN